MRIKSVKPINFLFYRTETKITGLAGFLPIGQQLFREAVKLNLTITGPVHWHYFGFQGDPEKPFTLEISIPVGEELNDYKGAFHFKRTAPFKCVSLVHEGNWFDMPDSYGQLAKFINENNLHPVLANREIYINADFNFPEANTTEIQIGVE
jgi:effector-binding domain-containing protein